uniref:Uncharacterized protein n=1 Tax=Vibrio sp. FF_273 TaxID=1652830 RepID=A0A0H4A1Q4_9VIBR|nr:hypothetical protein [Vibrio sp. FF_273]
MQNGDFWIKYWIEHRLDFLFPFSNIARKVELCAKRGRFDITM